MAILSLYWGYIRAILGYIRVLLGLYWGPNLLGLLVCCSGKKLAIVRALKELKLGGLGTIARANHHSWGEAGCNFSQF